MRATDNCARCDLTTWFGRNPVVKPISGRSRDERLGQNLVDEGNREPCLLNLAECDLESWSGSVAYLKKGTRGKGVCVSLQRRLRLDLTIRASRSMSSRLPLLETELKRRPGEHLASIGNVLTTGSCAINPLESGRGASVASPSEVETCQVPGVALAAHDILSHAEGPRVPLFRHLCVVQPAGHGARAMRRTPVTRGQVVGAVAIVVDLHMDEGFPHRAIPLEFLASRDPIRRWRPGRGSRTTPLPFADKVRRGGLLCQYNRGVRRDLGSLISCERRPWCCCFAFLAHTVRDVVVSVHTLPRALQ